MPIWNFIFLFWTLWLCEMSWKQQSIWKATSNTLTWTKTKLLRFLFEKANDNALVPKIDYGSKIPGTCVYMLCHLAVCFVLSITSFDTETLQTLKIAITCGQYANNPVMLMFARLIRRPSGRLGMQGSWNIIVLVLCLCNCAGASEGGVKKGWVRGRSRILFWGVEGRKRAEGMRCSL